MFITIITVTYNAEKYIERTLQSIDNQTFTDYEYIIIDGNSTDRTLEIAKKYKCVNKIISEKDNGLYDAMNKGIDIAKSDYLLFLNAGDSLRDNNVLNRLKTAKKADIIYGDTMIVDDNGKDLYSRKKRPPEELNFNSFQQGMVVCHQAFIVRREFCEKYDLKYHYSSDYDWCIKILKKARNIVNSNIIICNYLQGGLTEKNHLKSLIERFRIMVKHYGFCRAMISHVKFMIE